MSTHIAAALVAIETEWVDGGAETYLVLRLEDGQRLRVWTPDKRTPDTLLGGKRALPKAYKVTVSEA